MREGVLMGATSPHQLPPYGAHRTQFSDGDRANRELTGLIIVLAVPLLIVFVLVCLVEVLRILAVEAMEFMIGDVEWRG